MRIELQTNGYFNIYIIFSSFYIFLSYTYILYCVFMYISRRDLRDQREDQIFWKCYFEVNFISPEIFKKLTMHLFWNDTIIIYI